MKFTKWIPAVFVILVVIFLVSVARADTKTVITPSGSYLVITNGDTTSIIQTGSTGNTDSEILPQITYDGGDHTLITDKGSYMIRNNTIIQTGK